MAVNAAKVINLTLVRHGQTFENKKRIIQGQADTLLTDVGKQMARLLGDYWNKNGQKFDKVYSSDLTRAYETCQIVCNDKYEIVKDQLLRERSFGALQGSSLDELRKKAYEAGFDEDNYTHFRPEGGETMPEVQARIHRFCKNTLFPDTATGQHVLIVTHGGVVREFMKLFRKFGCPLSTPDMVITPNTSINQFEIHLTPENQIQMVIIMKLHEIPHLTGNAEDEALGEDQLNDGSTTRHAI